MTCLFQSGSEDLQASTDSKSSVFTHEPQVPTMAREKTAIEHPDQDKKVTIVNGQMVIRSTTTTGEESIMVRPTTSGGRKAQPVAQDDVAPGSLAPRSSPTHSSMQEQLRFQQNEALKRFDLFFLFYMEYIYILMMMCNTQTIFR